MTKEERLRSGESLMSHAMVFTGYDKRDGKSAPNKWRVENRYVYVFCCLCQFSSDFASRSRTSGMRHLGKSFGLKRHIFAYR